MKYTLGRSRYQPNKHINLVFDYDAPLNTPQKTASRNCVLLQRAANFEHTTNYKPRLTLSTLVATMCTTRFSTKFAAFYAANISEAYLGECKEGPISWGMQGTANILGAAREGQYLGGSKEQPISWGIQGMANILRDARNGQYLGGCKEGPILLIFFVLKNSFLAT